MKKDLPQPNDATTFDALEFGEHLVGDSKQARTRYPNGYGASVVQFTIGGSGGSYGVENGLWELAVLSWEGDVSHLTYKTSITSDVEGHLTPVMVTDLLQRIAAL